MKEYIKNIPNEVLKNLNIVVTDKDNNIIYASDHYLFIMGYEQDEVLGKNPSIFKHPSVTDFSSLWDNLESKHHWNGILKNIKKNGETIYFNGDIYKDFDNDGNHKGFHSIHTDISNTITNPHKFIFDNELSHLFFTNDIEYSIICFCDGDKQKLLGISKKVTELTGIDKNYIEKYNLWLSDIISSKSKYWNNIPKLISEYENGKDIIIQLKNLDTEYDKKFKVSIVSFIYQNKIARIFKLTDITNELNYSVQLNKLIESKNSFLAHISHEIKTPLNAINGFLSLLQLKEKDKEKLNYINIVANSSKHILDLTNDIIDLASIDNKKLEIIPREFSAKDIQNTIEVFFAKCLEKNIEFEIFISPHLPEVMLQDILRLKQIFTNLISNAIKFVDENGSIYIDIHHYNNSLYFDITDNGIGMSKKQLENIFKPFSQASKDIKMIYGGTGLGLALVKEIVELMNGTINVESELNKGTTFSVKIPIETVKNYIFKGKLQTNNILIFAPSFSKNTYNLLKKYLIEFSTAKIKKLFKLNNINDSFIFINYEDVKNKNILNELSKNNKLILIKKMSNVIKGFENNKNITELNLPLLGSSIYDALTELWNGCCSNKKNDFDSLNLHIKGNIMVVEDSNSNRLLIKELLSVYDVNITFAVNGKEAFELFKQNIINNKSTFDLILLDINIPIFNGHTVAKKIRNFEEKLNIERTPLIALTANRFNINSNNLKYDNIDEYITKPINLKQILSVIIKYTSNLNFPLKFNNLEKSTIMKNIRDAYLNNDKNIQKLIINVKNKFKQEEINILNEILKHPNNKRKFNNLYNEIMKLIRKNY